MDKKLYFNTRKQLELEKQIVSEKIKQLDKEYKETHKKAREKLQDRRIAIYNMRED